VSLTIPTKATGKLLQLRTDYHQNDADMTLSE